MAHISLKMMTPEKLILESEVSQITLPVLGGVITILPDHIPYIGALESGEVQVKEIQGAEEASFALSGGFVEFHNNTLIILADTAERADEIDIERAEEARARALKLSQEELTQDPEEYARTQAILSKELARIRVGRKHRSHTQKPYST